MSRDTIDSELRQLARDAYCLTRRSHPHMPAPDSAEGQRKIDRLFDIISQPFKEPSRG